MSARAELNFADWLAPAIACGAIALSDVLAMAAGPTAGAVLHAIVLLALLNAYVLVADEPTAQALLLLGLVPLLDLITLALPVRWVSDIARAALEGGLLLLALGYAERLAPFETIRLRLPRRGLRAQLAIAAAAIPAGIVGEVILAPRPLIRPAGPLGAMLAAFVLAALVAPSLELLFRWVIQPALVRLYGMSALVLVNLLFAGVYLAARSPGYAVFMGLAGLGLSLAIVRTRTISGAVAAHGLLDIGLLIVWPMVLR